eukprot:gene12314-biopygen2412
MTHDGSSLSQWQYVDTSLNPADDASRSLSADSLINSRILLYGPEFLQKEEHEWPEGVFIEDLSEDDVEVRKLVLTHLVQINSSKDEDVPRKYVVTMAQTTEVVKENSETEVTEDGSIEI